MSQNPKTILWIDDKDDLWELAKLQAKNRGFNIFFAAHPDAAMIEYHNIKPDYIALDVILKTYSTDRTNGFEICEKIRECEKHQHLTPSSIIIMMTNFPLEYAKIEGMITGANWTFIKDPLTFEISQIFDKFQELEGKREIKSVPSITSRSNPTHKWLVVIIGIALLVCMFIQSLWNMHFYTLLQEREKQIQDDKKNFQDNVRFAVNQIVEDHLQAQDNKIDKVISHQGLEDVQIQDTRDDLNNHGLLNKDGKKVK